MSVGSRTTGILTCSLRAFALFAISLKVNKNNGESPMSSYPVNRIASYFLILLVASPAIAQNDMRGSRDHPKIPRIEGAVIYGYQYSDFDEGKFASKQDGKWIAVHPSGKRTRILYLAPTQLSVPGVFHNYQAALESLGELEELTSCRSDCGPKTASDFVWETSNRIPTTLKGDKYLYEVWDNVQPNIQKDHKDQGYWYGIVTTPKARYHVSIYTAELTNGGSGTWRTEPDVAGTRSIHLEVLEEADFEPTLKIVTAEEITKGITEKGKIALYGIYFDFDSDVLQSESAPALEAIASTLKKNSSLKIFVVGHTDNQGAYDYNLDLSKRRAQSVVAALTANHGIAADRLVAAGVGPVAPVASNRTEEGQALNRRVELVEL